MHKNIERNFRSGEKVNIMDSTLSFFSRLAEIFSLEGEIVSYDTIQNGNINSTYRVDFRREDGSEKSYLFQRVNTYVFKDPEKVMENIDAVTTYLRDTAGIDETPLHFHHTKERKNFFRDEKGDFWRIGNYIRSVTYNECDDLSILKKAGEAFGKFQMHLTNFDTSTLHEIIPDFHNTKKRLDTLFAHVDLDPVGRVAEVAEEIDLIRRNRALCSRLTEAAEQGILPLRVTHNDTKINNVLFDATTGDPLTVIDLDTVMPGLSVHDFGDAVRFAASTAAEDEPDVNKIALDLSKFRAFAEGFVGTTAGALTEEEIDNMALGAVTITFELASRFLDDYITGDKYFKVNYPGHNLVRTRAQLKLASDMLNKYNEMQSIIHDISKR